MESSNKSKVEDILKNVDVIVTVKEDQQDFKDSSISKFSFTLSIVKLIIPFFTRIENQISQEVDKKKKKEISQNQFLDFFFYSVSKIQK